MENFCGRHDIHPIDTQLRHLPEHFLIVTLRLVMLCVIMVCGVVLSVVSPVCDTTSFGQESIGLMSFSQR
jgi:hypothetical protein